VSNRRSSNSEQRSYLPGESLVASLLTAPTANPAVQEQSIEINAKGKWSRVPALTMGRETVVLRGGMVKIASIHDEEWLEDEIQDPAQWEKILGSRSLEGKRADIFSFAQKVPGSAPKYKYPFELMSIAAIRLPGFKEWWERLPQEARKNVRRAQKRGVIVTLMPFSEALMAHIRRVNDDSPIRQGIRNAHYGKSLAEIAKDYSAFLDRSDFICACVGEEVIGFLKIVYRGEVASILNLTTMPSQADKRPANALVAKAVELCDARGVSFITFGQFNYGNKKDSPLREFKIRNGFEETFKPKFFVPLTTWGQIAMKANFHRGLLGILPSGAISMGLAARARCYYVKDVVMSRCSSMLERPNSDRQMGRSNPPAGSKS
jgi:hypothetical protein